MKRFPCLWIGMRFRKLETVLNVIVATAFLHNICKLFNDNDTPPLPTDMAMAYDLTVEEENRFQRNAESYNHQTGRISNEFLRNYFETLQH